MSQRKYSIYEIDQMRDAIGILCAVETSHNDINGVSRFTVEDRLRTYMLNGTDPEELQAHALAVAERKAA